MSTDDGKKVAAEWHARMAELKAERKELLEALKDMVENTKRWNAAVEAIIGRLPETGIDLVNAEMVIARVERNP